MFFLKIHTIRIFGGEKITEIPLDEITKIKNRPRMKKPSWYAFLVERLCGDLYIHNNAGTIDFATIGNARDSLDLKNLNIELI